MDGDWDEWTAGVVPVALRQARAVQARNGSPVPRFRPLNAGGLSQRDRHHPLTHF